jgi:hypothetical protein
MKAPKTNRFPKVALDGASQQSRNTNDRFQSPVTWIGPKVPTTRRHRSLFKPTLVQQKSKKSELAISEPRRHRDKAHLKFVASQPCLVCGRSPLTPTTYDSPSPARWDAR